MESAKKTENDNKLFLLLLAILAIVIVVLIYTFAIGRLPESYTEIWLESEISTVKANSEFEVKFVIFSHESSTKNYSYKIIAEDELKASGNLSLASGTKELVSEKISFKKSYAEKQKILIEVLKEGKKEPYTLWFWVNVVD